MFKINNIILSEFVFLLFFLFNSSLFASSSSFICYYNYPVKHADTSGTWAYCCNQNGVPKCGSCGHLSGVDKLHSCVWVFKNGSCSCVPHCPAGQFYYNDSCVDMNQYMSQTLSPAQFDYYQKHCKVLLQSAYVHGKELCWDKVICDGHSKSVSVSCGESKNKGQKYFDSKNSDKPLENNLSSPSCVGALVYNSDTGSIKCLDTNQSSYFMPDYKYFASNNSNSSNNSNDSNVSNRSNSYSDVLLSSSANNLALLHSDLQSLNSKINYLSNSFSNVANLQSITNSDLQDISHKIDTTNSDLQDISHKMDTTNSHLSDINKKLNVLNDINKTFTNVTNFSKNNDITAIIKNSVNSALSKYSNHSFITSTQQQCRLKYSFTIANKVITLNLQDFVDNMPIKIIKSLLYFFASLGIFYSCIRTD